MRGETRGECARCKRRRATKLVLGPNLHPKGMEMCRKCEQGYQLIQKLRNGEKI